MTTKTTDRLAKLRALASKCRRGVATDAEIARLEELERAERAARAPLPPARTIWDLPIARALFEADRRDR